MPLFNVRWIPWRYNGSGIVVGRDGEPIAYLAGRMNDENHAVAGNLMAAPADLYQALKAITDCYGVGYKSADKFVEHVHDFMMEGRAALAKARGEQ